LRAFGAISSQATPDKAEALARLRQEMQQALPQRMLVFGEGNPDAKLVIAGEAPGGEEEATLVGTISSISYPAEPLTSSWFEKPQQSGYHLIGRRFIDKES
jgi:hypothetical protein